MLNDEALEGRLHQELDRVQPGSVPLDALIARGRVIKARLRAGFAAGLAAVAAVTVGAPAVLGGGGSSGVSSGGHPVVLASGTIDGEEWSFVMEEPSPTGCPGSVSGHWKDFTSGICLGTMPATTDPVDLTSNSAHDSAGLFIAELRQDVDHVTVTATDGTVQTPTVAVVSGRRYAFFALPPKQGAARLDAIGADGKTVAYSVPYNGPDGALSVVASWYPAGTAPTQAAVKQTLFSGKTSSSTPVTVTVDMGPFGVCYLLSAEGYGPACHSVTPPAPTALSFSTYPPFGDRVLLTEVNNTVDHVDAALSDGTTKRLTPVRVGGHSFAVLFLAADIELRDAESYDASGARLAKTP